MTVEHDSTDLKAFLMDQADAQWEDFWHRRRTAQPIRRQTQVCGFPIALISNDARLLAACEEGLSYFTGGPRRQNETPLSVRLFVRPPEQTPACDPLAGSDDGSVPFIYEGHDGWASIDMGVHGHCTIDRDQRHALGFVSGSLAARTEIISRFVLGTTVHALLSGCSLIQWHAATLQRGDHTVMLIGDDDSGKSTTALALFEAGYSILSESVTYSRETPDGIELMGYPVGRLSLRSGSLAFFPAWRERGLLMSSSEGPKWRFDLRDLAPERVMTQSLVAPCLDVLFVSVRQPQTVARRLTLARAQELALRACSFWEQAERREKILDHVQRTLKRARCYQLEVACSPQALVRQLDNLLV